MNILDVYLKSLFFELDYGVDCASLYKAGVNASGIYALQPDPSDNSTRFKLFVI